MVQDYHFHPRYDGTWIAIKDHVRGVSVRASSQEDAVRRTLEIARRWNARVLLHHRNGRVEELHDLH